MRPALPSVWFVPWKGCGIIRGENVQYLYRGVSAETLQGPSVGLAPKKKGQKFAAFACAGDPHALCGSGIEAGESDLNRVILHQWQQAGIPTPGISTTPLKDGARFYALSGGIAEKGFVLKLSVPILIQLDVSIYRVNDLVRGPAVHKDDEHVLVAKDFGKIPHESIVDIVEV